MNIWELKEPVATQSEPYRRLNVSRATAGRGSGPLIFIDDFTANQRGKKKKKQVEAGEAFSFSQNASKPTRQHFIVQRANEPERTARATKLRLLLSFGLFFIYFLQVKGRKIFKLASVRLAEHKFLPTEDPLNHWTPDHLGRWRWTHLTRCVIHTLSSSCKHWIARALTRTRLCLYVDASRALEYDISISKTCCRGKKKKKQYRDKEEKINTLLSEGEFI